MQNSNNYLEILNIITKIKLRINSYGIGTENKYFRDSHIWDTIKTIENCDSQDLKMIDTYKQQLIHFCSCLLKYDWERSKTEVTGNNYTNFIILWGISYAIIYNLYTVLSYNSITNILSICISGTAVLSLSIIVSIFIMNMFKLNDRTRVLQQKKYFNKKALHSKFVNKLLELTNKFMRIVDIIYSYFLLPLITFVFLYAIIYIFSICIADFAGINFIITASNLLMCLIVLEMFSLNKFYSDRNYVDTIEAIRKSYIEKNNK